MKKFLVHPGQQVIRKGKHTITLSWKPRKLTRVIIDAVSEDSARSEAQRRLARLWSAAMAASGSAGMLDELPLADSAVADDVYQWFKWRFLVPHILAEESEPMLSELIDFINAASPAKQVVMIRLFVRSSYASIKAMTAALNEWDYWMTEQGIDHQNPEDHRFALEKQGLQEWYDDDNSRHGR